MVMYGCESNSNIKDKCLVGDRNVSLVCSSRHLPRVELTMSKGEINYFLKHTDLTHGGKAQATRTNLLG